MDGFFAEKIFLETVESTNTYLKENDFPDKTVVYSYHQTRGRGRNNRSWVDSKEKNLALSFLLKPGKLQDSRKEENPLWYVAACSIALIKVLEQQGIKNSWIKWPNDIYIGNSKLSGVLTEIQWSSSSNQKIIVGIGINVNNSREDLAGLERAATSVFIETGTKYNMHHFTRDYLKELAFWLSGVYEQKNIEKTRETWLHYCNILGKKVEWDQGKQKITGIIEKIDDSGYIVLNVNGIIHRVISGDITVLS